MKTTIDHLLTPRFEVIADYPYSPYSIGDLLTDEWEIPTIHLYPHLFKPLQWWEKRTSDEMPKYLKIDNVKLRLEGSDFSYYKVLKWHMDILFAQVKEDRMSGCSLLSFSSEYTYQPCSEEEYLNNMNL